MDSSSFPHGFQYNFQHYGEAGMSMSGAAMMPAISTPAAAMLPPMSTPNTGIQTMATAISTMVPPLHTLRVPTGTGNEGEASFNDSGYFSSPQTSQFTALNSRLQPSSSNQLVGSYNHSPSRAAGSAVSSLMATSRPSWQEDFPNINDEWDRNFINNFEENLFGIDATDLNNMVDGILASPIKSPYNSPFKSPRQNRSAAQGLGQSPFSHLSTSNVVLSSLKKSPVSLDASPLRKLFSTPSPIKGLDAHTRVSPVTRQRRRILQSPTKKPDVSSHFLDLPDFLQNINKEIEQNNDLGVTPFQRTNSLGFTPTEELSASPSWYEENSVQSSHPLVSGENSMPCDQSVTPTPTQEINIVAQPRQHKKNKTEKLYSPEKKEMPYYKQQSPSSKRSPARLAHGRISVTRHSHLVDKLDSKGALRFVRARFSEVLQKAVADAEKRHADMQSKLKGRVKKQEQYSEISQVLSQPVAGGSSISQSSTSIPCYTQIQPHRPAGKRRQEILPKPTPDWPQRQPCKIAPKKRKR